VRDYNDGVQRVPDLVIARSAGFAAAEFYQARAEERQPVQVQVTP
jgi:LemA protein